MARQQIGQKRNLDYWDFKVGPVSRHRIEALWLKTHNPNWSVTSPAAEQLERDLEMMRRPFRDSPYAASLPEGEKP